MKKIEIFPLCNLHIQLFFYKIVCNFNRHSRDGKKYSKLRKQDVDAVNDDKCKSLMPNPPPPPQISEDIESGKNFDRSFNFSWCDDVEEEEEKRFDRLKNSKQET